MANAFEKMIGQTFLNYREQKIASLVFLHPPMRPVGMMGRVPCFIQSGKAPFDVAGIYYDKCGTAIGVELKETRDHEKSLSIVGPDKRGSGLQYHQLEGLVQVHEAGGIAMVMWSNGGEIGILGGNAIQLTKLTYDASLKAEKMKKTPAKGSRSIPWEMFSMVKYDGKNLPLWLPPHVCVRSGKRAA